MFGSARTRGFAGLLLVSACFVVIAAYLTARDGPALGYVLGIALAAAGLAIGVRSVWQHERQTEPAAASAATAPAESLPEVDTESVATALRETVARCLPRLDESRLDTCFRSEALRPDLFAYELLGGVRYPTAQSLHISAVKDVCSERARLLQQQELPRSGGIAGGRLMYFAPDVNLYHGLEYHECGGYIDRFTAPPWDTWVTCVNTRHDGVVILCWVHPALIAKVCSALEVNPEGSLGWAAEHHDPAVAALARSFESVSG